MGTVVIYKYSKNKWHNICSEDNQIDRLTQFINCESGHRIEKALLEKYYPSRVLLDPKKSKFSVKEIYKNLALEDLVFLWNDFETKKMNAYEKIYLRVFRNFTVISRESLPIVINCLEKIENEYPLTIPSQNGFPEIQSLAKGCSEIFKKIHLGEGEYLSLGHSTGGFWGNEVPDSIRENYKENSSDTSIEINKIICFLGEHFNYPADAGKEICFDISTDQSL
jgi:hypothetical protein